MTIFLYKSWPMFSYDPTFSEPLPQQNLCMKWRGLQATYVYRNFSKEHLYTMSHDAISFSKSPIMPEKGIPNYAQKHDSLIYNRVIQSLAITQQLLLSVLSVYWVTILSLYATKWIHKVQKHWNMHGSRFPARTYTFVKLSYKLSKFLSIVLPQLLILCSKLCIM